MIKRLIAALILLCGTCLAQNLGSYNGNCSKGGQNVVTQGLVSSGTEPIGSVTVNIGSGLIASYPSCIVTVYPTGSSTPVPSNQIFANNLSTPTVLGNPFTANADGSFLFFAAVATGYDITMSGAGLPSTVTITDVILCNTNCGSTSLSSLTVGTLNATVGLFSELNDTEVVDGIINTTVNQAVGKLPSTGGSVFIPPGSYACPNPPPANVSLINWAAGANATVTSGGWDGVTGINTQVTFTNCTSGWTVTGSNTRVEGITVDFANSGTGVIFKGSQFNHWKHVTLLHCGNTTTPCLQLAGYGAGPAGNTALNVFEDMVINPNSTSGQYAGCIQALGNAFSSTNGAVDNSFFRTTCVGNILYFYDGEGGGGGGGTDTNSFYYTQALQAGSGFTSYLLGFNTLNPNTQVDADGTSFYDLYVTGVFTYGAKLGESNGNLVANTNYNSATLYDIVTTGTPRITWMFRGGPTGGFGDFFVGNFSSAASAALTNPSGFGQGDIGSWESATAGCYWFGSDGTTDLCRNSNEFNLITSQSSFYVGFPPTAHLGSFGGQDPDQVGTITISGSTSSSSISFNANYNTVPVILLQPTGDPNACGGYWPTVTGSSPVTAFKANSHATCSVTFNYFIWGNAN